MRAFPVFLLAVLAMASAIAQNPDAAQFLHNGVTAHRGNSSEFPENTLTAFESGIAVGADWIECDILRTRDGHLVVIHDRDTRRVGDRNLVVAESTYEELQAVDVATEFRRRHGLSLTDCPPQRMPLLEDVLRLVMKQTRTRLSIQPKMDCVADAVALVKRLGAEAWVGFNDGNLAYMAEVKQLAPAIPVFWDRGQSDLAEDIRIARQHGFETLVLNERAVTAEKVAQLKEAGLDVGVWTVNEPADWERFLALGVERIYTDRPRQLLAFKAAPIFRLYTRATAETWPRLKPFAQEGDLFWGRQVDSIPPAIRALTFGSYEALKKTLANDDLRKYAALNLDGEYRDFKAALQEAKAIRVLVDEHNAKLKRESDERPLRFVAFYHMRIIDAQPEIVKYPDVVMVGKSYWTAENIDGKGERRGREATHYVKLIREAGREPGILLGSPEKAKHEAIGIIQTLKTCLAPAAEGGLGVRVIGFYYERDKVETLLTVLREVRPKAAPASESKP